MTRNLKLFILFSLLWSVPFYTALNWVQADEATRGPWMLLFSTLYGVGFSIAGKQLGKHDDQSRVRYSLGIRYGFASLLSSALVGVIWVIVWKPSQLQSFVLYFGTSIIIGLAIASYLSRHGIKGMPKKELFK